MQNKNILVTGGWGFIGSHFVELLLKNCVNCNIDILDIKDYCYSTKTYRYLKSLYSNSTNNVEIISKDINYYIFKKDYNYIVNFAAQSHVDTSINNGDSFITTNVNGTYNLLKQINDKTRFVQISTDEVYGSLSYFDRSSLEDDELKPSSIYSSTKAAADLITLSFYKTHKKNVIVTRCCNNFGPRQYYEKFIPKSIKSILNNENIKLYGMGQNIRQWIYVRDHCEQVYELMLLGEPGQIYNIEPTYYANSTEYKNIDIANKIIKSLTKTDDKRYTFIEDRKGHDLRYSLNGYKTKQLIKKDNQPYLPGMQRTFDQDLEYTIKWYKLNIDWWNK